MRHEESHRPRKRLYTIAEAAEYIGRSPWAVRSLIWSGKLPAVRDGKRIFIDVYDMDAWVERSKVNYLD